MSKNMLPLLPKLLKRKLPFSLLIAAIIAVLLTLTTFGMSLFAHAPQIPRTQLPSRNTDAVYSCPTFTVAGDDTGGTQTWNATTSDYNLELGIGPPQSIWTFEQVTQMTQHGCPIWGEATNDKTVSGHASPIYGDYELQLTIKDQHTGQVVTNMESHLHVLIYYRHSPKVQQVKVMGLYDPADQSINFHYGTNVPLDRQNIDRMVATINGQSVTFSIAA